MIVSDQSHRLAASNERLPALPGAIDHDVTRTESHRRQRRSKTTAGITRRRRYKVDATVDAAPQTNITPAGLIPTSKQSEVIVYPVTGVRKPGRVDLTEGPASTAARRREKRDKVKSSYYSKPS